MMSHQNLQPPVSTGHMIGIPVAIQLPSSSTPFNNNNSYPQHSSQHLRQTTEQTHDIGATKRKKGIIYHSISQSIPYFLNPFYHQLGLFFVLNFVNLMGYRMTG